MRAGNYLQFGQPRPAFRLTRRTLLRAGIASAGGVAIQAGLACSRKPQANQPGSGPGAAASKETPRSGGTLTVRADYNATTYDPHLSSANSTLRVMGAVASRLFRSKTGLDPAVVDDHVLENDLAISAESPDAITWTFKLRPDATFHDIPPVSGHAVEAEDVRSSFVRALTTPQNPNRSALGMINPNQIQAPDKQTVVFKLNYPYAPFPQIMASGVYSWILPREALAGAYDPAKKVIGSGPFLFDSYTPDVEFLFKKNPSWFESGQPYVDELKYAIVIDPAQQLAQFLGGNLAEGAPDPNDLDTIKKSAPDTVFISGRGTAGAGYPIYMQLGDPSSAFQDVRLRRGLSMALDRDTMAKTLYNNQCDFVFMISNGFGKWALTMKDLDPETASYYKYDQAQAKKLIQATGADSGSYKLGYTVNSGNRASDYNTKVQMVGSMLGAVGIKTVQVPLDFTKDYIGGGKGARYGNFPKDMIICAGLATFSEPDEVIFQYFDSKSTISETRVKDPTLDAMIDKGRTIVNADERLKAYKDIQKYIANQMYTVSGQPQGYSYTAVHPWVRNYQYSNTLGQATETYAKVWLSK